MSWAAIVVAAGRGTRFGRPKQLVPLAGKPMLAWSIETLAEMPEVRAMIVTSELQTRAEIESLVRSLAGHLEPRVVVGGAERQDSVRLALDELPDSCEYVLVHDGARPMVRADDVRRGMSLVGPGVASLLATPVVDTVKQVDAAGKIVCTLDRSALWAAQTPQLATAGDLRRAHDAGLREGLRVTDDATLLELVGCDVYAVDGSPQNFKITVPADLARAEALLRERAPARWR